MTLVVINLDESQALALIVDGLVCALLGFIIAWLWARARTLNEVNSQWFAERERVHQERKRAGEFKRI